jgi:fatty-acyl-CoA synthase/long-chain acyl-CoA synthetase
MEMNVSEVINFNAQKFPSREALIFQDKRITYGQLNDSISQRANLLIEQGVKQGDHVSTLFLNCTEVVESITAVWRAGAVLVPLSFRASAEELIYILDNADVSAIIFQEGFEKMIRKITPSLPKIKKLFCSGKNPPNDFINFESKKAEQPTQLPKLKIKESDMCTIVYTSGTTGKPKGVVITHKNLIWAIASVMALNYSGYDDYRKHLTIYPFFHIGAIMNTYNSLCSGNTMVMLEKFDPKKIFETIEKEKVDSIANPPTAYKMLLRFPNKEQYDLSSVIGLGSGSERMPDETSKQLQKIFPNAQIVESYGLTESTGFLTTRRGEFMHTKLGSVGKTSPFIRIRIIDKDGNDVAPNEPGEIIAKGPSMMTEYYKNPEKTAEALRDGWLYTEDIGRFDEDGFLYIKERKHHMIISGGENIYPKEVEAVLYQHPKILEAAVFGLPDETYGEMVAAAVVLKRGEQLTYDEVAEFCKEHIASFKKPKVVHFVDALPKNPIGKIMRSELKKKYTT